MDTAVILAAGIGSRMGELTRSIPKCCLTVGKESLIARLVRQLLSKNPALDIRIVVGHCAEAIRQELAGFGSSVSLVNNDDFRCTNNMESCRLAFQSMELGKSTIGIINADCIYHDDIVARIFRSPPDIIAADGSRYHPESMKIKLIDGAVRDISKSLPPEPQNVTSIDFYKFHASVAHLLYDVMIGFFVRNDRNKWLEVAIAEVVKQESVIIKPLDISGLEWAEIDDADELASARRLWT